MRGRRASLLFAVFAALLCSAPVPARTEPATPRPAPAPPAEPPVLSLVIARANAALPFPDHYGPSSCGACLNSIHIGAFDSGETLYGPPIPPQFGATMYWHSWFTHGSRPMLLVVQHPSNGMYHVVAYAGGPDADGMGCLRREDIANLDWHPAGAAIVARDGGLCASLAAIAALPPRPDPRFGAPVVTISVDDFRRLQPSVVIARLRGRRGAGPPACAPNGACRGVTVDAGLADVETLSGPRVPRTLTVRLVSEAAIPAGGDLIMLIRRGEGPGWTSDWFRPLEPPGRESCFPSEDLWRLGVRALRFSARRGERTCFLL